ncbi:hypothetical protein ESCO_003143 [Escovopsis weberi]|uniref:Extracellular membrane protein CFEM domain-containing protein n=1 Tax=Escovopsis weberi TaxID=150374 RepID=A0A0M8MVD7_ESCWE|nr:hypothetical protein ESCO_003143 [Escovopsis weberi]
MQPSHVLMLALAAVLPVEACKCINQISKQQLVSGTERCCKIVKGRFTGDDCAANSISHDLATFDGCCEDLRKPWLDPFKSDCRYPN